MRNEAQSVRVVREVEDLVTARATRYFRRVRRFCRHNSAQPMAKHPKRRRRKMGRYIRGSVDESLALGTLAAKTVIAGNFDETVNERTLVSSVVARWAMINFTPGTLDGPILCGVAHSDYTDAEIEEWIENTGSWDEGDLVNQEIGGRKIRRVGIFDTPAAATQAAVLNDGKAIKTKLNWILLQGQTLKHWFYNLGTSALATTDPECSTQGHVNLFPK